MIATLGIALASFLAFVDPPDIAVEWSGQQYAEPVDRHPRVPRLSDGQRNAARREEAGSRSTSSVPN